MLHLGKGPDLLRGQDWLIVSREQVALLLHLMVALFLVGGSCTVPARSFAWFSWRSSLRQSNPYAIFYNTVTHKSPQGPERYHCIAMVYSRVVITLLLSYTKALSNAADNRLPHSSTPYPAILPSTPTATNMPATFLACRPWTSSQSPCSLSMLEKA